MSQLPYSAPTYAKIISPRSVTVHFLSGKSFHWPDSHPQYANAKALLSESATDEEVLELMDISAQLVKATAAYSDIITVTRDGVLYKGKVLHTTLTERILQFQAEGLDIGYLVKFLENLMTNPIRDSVLSLYDFLEHGHVPITPDGCFLAYKKVRGDYTDIHSGKFDNSVGANPKVESWEVDADRTRECSYGLHVCSREYLPNFGSGYGNRVVICKINPAHVVAVPADYNFAKMRVTEYLVVGELNDEQKADIFDNRATVRPGETMDGVNWDETIDDELRDYPEDEQECEPCPGDDDPDCCNYVPPQDDDDQFGNRRW